MNLNLHVLVFRQDNYIMNNASAKQYIHLTLCSDTSA